jgi:hypothetical protein
MAAGCPARRHGEVGASTSQRKTSACPARRGVLPAPGLSGAPALRGAARLSGRGPARGPGRRPVRLHPREPAVSGTGLPRRGAGVLRLGRPGPKTAPAKDAARPRIIELRAAGHSIDEIAQVLAAEGIPLNRTGIAEVIAGQGLPRMWRRPDEQRGGPAREIQARAEAADFTALPGRAETRLAGLFLAIPDLVAAAGYPSTPRIPALPYILSLLALKLTSTRWVPRLRHRRRPRRCAVRRAHRAAEGHCADHLLLPARALPAGRVPDRAGQGCHRGRGSPRRSAQPGLPRGHAPRRGPGA